MEKLLQAADFGSFQIGSRTEKQISQFKADVANLVQGQASRFRLIPPLPAKEATATAADKAAAGAEPEATQAPATEPKMRLMLRQSVELDTVDLAVILPDPAWSKETGLTFKFQGVGPRSCIESSTSRLKLGCRSYSSQHEA